MNFTGAFLLRTPEASAFDEFYNQNIKDRVKYVVTPHVKGEDNLLIVVKQAWDGKILNALLQTNLNFAYYPNVSFKDRIQHDETKTAEEVLDRQQIVLEQPAEILSYLRRLQNSKLDINVSQTLNYLNLVSGDVIIKGKNKNKRIKLIFDKNQNLIAKVSPKNEKGEHFAFIYPRYSDEVTRHLIFAQDGTCRSAENYFDFKAKFIEASNKTNA